MDREFETADGKLLARNDEQGVLRIVLNNPSSHNSLTGGMLDGLRLLFAQASSDVDVRVILVKGFGDKAFASGADISEQAERAAKGITNPDRGSFVDDLLSCSKPVVAMIRGYCLGGGLLVAMAADIRIASDDAVFGIPATRLGVAYPLAGIDLLVDLVGRAAATEIMLLGERFDAVKAKEIGLVTRVSPGSEIDHHTEELLLTLLGNAPLSLAAAKASIAHARDVERRGTPTVRRQIDDVWASGDAAEGMDAFFGNRP
ncbi:MAG: enoyl-CoA hydratase-related protein, partial [Acidimicrobiales bacterium]